MVQIWKEIVGCEKNRRARDHDVDDAHKIAQHHQRVHEEERGGYQFV